MNKRGGLFYVIDAFIASGIIAVTIAVVFSSFVSSPNVESTRNELNNFISFFEQTTLANAPPQIERSVVLFSSITHSQDDIFQVLAELMITNQTFVAFNLVSQVTDLILPPQFGVYVHFDGVNVYNRSTARRDVSKVVLTKQVSTMLVSESTLIERTLDWTSFASTTGTQACNTINYDCRFVVASCDNDETYELCDTSRADFVLVGCTTIPTYIAECAFINNATILGPYTIEVSIWS